MRRLARDRALLAPLVLAGLACATPARTQHMVPAALELPGPRAGTVAVAVTGGSATNPLWTSEIGDAELRVALEQAILRHGPFAAVAPGGEHRLAVELLAVEQPFLGLDYEVTVRARWTLAAGEAQVWTADVEASHVTTFAEAPLASLRLRMANEGAAQALIAAGLARLAAHLAGGSQAHGPPDP